MDLCTFSYLCTSVAKLAMAILDFNKVLSILGQLQMSI